MHTLENNKLKISVKNAGAELCEISSVKNNTDFMWNANPNIWAGYAPNLFPIIGALKNGAYFFENEKYTLPKHGFIRNNKDILLHKQTANSLTFKLTSSKTTLRAYPFKFEFYITYTLTDNSIEILHTIKNIDIKTMYFSVGGHPAFKCPVFENESYDDYILEFEHIENSKTHLINLENGLILSQTKPIFNNSNTIQLKHDLFNEDALVFKDLKSKKITLKSNKNGDILSVSYPDFTYLGIWAKPTGDYVCIEPWLGIADNESTNQNLTEKEGIIPLIANKTFKAAYNIKIHNSHLV
ncbi:aldose epimerase [Pseudalgibacter alginicilyticus]|uniref:Aldose epimerase n=1 Tax=Pseudalgibacter alginicilyticus TaxID=1736674 RepID=A0A0P0D5C1_9FLAO|nr:aldose 1-epimerase family protein [Pseudalgibacter alginicilyticus]ALJ03784.1 aldose epimerase [Pseudalgibacter alginicilyticus]